MERKRVKLLPGFQNGHLEFALQLKLGGLMDEVVLIQGETTIIALTLWQPESSD